jgi:hypothetical protein
MNNIVDIMYVMRSLYTRNALQKYIVIKQVGTDQNIASHVFIFYSYFK